MSFIETIIQWINENPGKSVGACIGFLLGIVIIAFGPVKAFFIVLLVVIGLLIGKIRDDGLYPSHELKRLFKRKRD